MKTYNLIYDKSVNFDQIITDLTDLGITINHIFPSLAIINVSGEVENFPQIDGILVAEEDSSINPEPAVEWHQLRVGSRTLPMKSKFIPKNLGTGVSVYLVDSGIKVDHSEFEDSNIVNLYSYNDTFDDEIGHGTAVASVIIGKNLGISTEATLKNVKIPMGQSIPLSSLLEAFNAVAADKNEEEFAVINCSWTIPKSMILDNLVADLRSQGFLVVAAAGNTLSDADNLSPVGYDAVLGVGASDAFDRVISWGQGVGSNFGKEVDLFAPGIDVMVATKAGGTTEASGTSIATGIVSGIVAQYIFDLKERGEVNISVDNIQQSIILRAVPDVLFRNETIYEDTPNKLIMALILEKYYTNNIPPIINIEPNTSYELTYDIDTRYVVSINIDNISLGTKTYHRPEWVSLDNNTNTITIAPSEEFIGKYYRIYVEMLDSNGEQVIVYPVVISVGDVIETEVVEHYHWTVDENDNIIVTMAACSVGTPYCAPGGYYAGCSQFQYPKAGSGCACIGNTCVSF
jgi:hypothetical protein